MWEHLHHLFAVPTFDSHFWTALLGIIWIDLLLSGDNALVIAMVTNQLPEHQRVIGRWLGAGAAVALRVVFAVLITEVMGIKGLGIVGGLLLLWIAGKMLLDGSDPEHKPAASLWGAVAAIAVADAAMSLDNVMAIAGLSHGHDSAGWLMAFGLLLSIPLVIGGATILAKILKAAPWLIWAGAALLAWVAGGIIAEDKLITQWIQGDHSLFKLAFSIFGMLIVLMVGLANRIWRDELEA